MKKDQEPPQQAGCGLPNLLLPIFLIGGPVLGWSVARPFGWWWGLLGGGVGFVLIVPAIGLTIALVIGIVMTSEWLTGRLYKKDSGSKSTESIEPNEFN